MGAGRIGRATTAPLTRVKLAEEVPELEWEAANDNNPVDESSATGTDH